VHRRLGLQFVDLREVVAIANSLTKTYCEVRGGPEALRPLRAEPMHNDEIAQLFLLDNQTRLGGWTYRDPTISGRSFKACVALITWRRAASGARRWRCLQATCGPSAA
jgi:hypothetical protein